MENKTMSALHENQLKNQIAQFMRIFSNMKVTYGVDRDQDGNLDIKTVPVMYGDMDRVVAKLFHGESFTTKSLPTIAAHMSSLELAPERRLNKRHIDNSTVTLQDGNKVNKSRLTSVPYSMMMDLIVYTSNNSQAFQLLEAIMLMFNPKLSVKTSDNALDWGYISNVELMSMSPEHAVPSGVESRIVTWRFSFKMDIWLHYPIKEHTSIIREIDASIKELTTKEELGAIHIDEDDLI